MDLNTRTIEDHKGLEWRGSSNSASRGGEGRSEVMNVMGSNRLFNRRSQADSCSCKRAFHTLRRAHVQSRAMDLNGRSGEPQGWQWTLSLGSVGSSSHSLTASTVAMLPAVKLRSAEPQTMSMLHSAPPQDWSSSHVIMTPVINS